MVPEEAYRDWVQRYVVAWNSNDRADIGALFSDDARYFTEPHAQPWRGRDEIVRRWLENKDEPGDTTFDYEVLVATPEIGIIRGRTAYARSRKAYSNLWELHLNDSGACTEFVEWWIEA